MDERTNEMELVENNESNIEEVNDYGIVESDPSDDAEIDLAKILKWVVIGVGAAGVVVAANREKLKEAKRKADEKRMRKLADKLGFDVVNPEDYIEVEDEDYESEEDCESEE